MPGARFTLIDELLREQRSLTAVEQFSRLHESRGLAPESGHYRRLLPAAEPGPGQQYAFEVDLDKCSGCKACVTACHALNGLDETESWRTVGLLISQPWADDRPPALQHVSTACHHCADPACLNGCPVLAYDKDPVTGIVRHLDDQCIGCSYCVMKCPYDVPKYSQRLGIVRKCDLCSQRLAVGEAPACAQACPNEAITVTLSATGVKPDGGLFASGRSDAPHAGVSLPAFPDPAITQPTTRFVTRRSEVALMIAADATALHPAPAHPPLSLMLVLTQLGVGAAGAAVWLGPQSGLLAWLAFGTTAAGVGAATLHLGQPLRAWRGFLGWRRSWLSRELLAFGAALGAMGTHTLALRTSTAMAAWLVGLLAVFCSAMIYVDTRRAFWSARITLPKFALTVMALAAASALVYGGVGESEAVVTGAALALAVATVGKLGLEVGFVVCARNHALHKSALLHKRVFRSCFFGRLGLGVLGGVALPVLMVVAWVPATLPYAITVLFACVAGEVMERHLFFVCEAAPRTPGGVAP